jgi:hypothetical protein
MKYKDFFNDLTFESFKKVFLSQSAREKKQMLIETGIGKTVRDDKIAKLFRLFITGKIEEDMADMMIKRFFLQDTMYDRASLRPAQKEIISKFLDYSDIPHTEGMVDDQNVGRFKKLKIKKVEKFIDKEINEEKERFIFFVYAKYLAFEYGLKDLNKTIMQHESCKAFIKSPENM